MISISAELTLNADWSTSTVTSVGLACDVIFASDANITLHGL